MTATPQLGGLADTQGKEPERERLLADMNALLAPLEHELESLLASGPKYPPVFILGPPRGGTTLCSQLLTRTGLFGTIPNFVARFWLAPAVGLRLGHALGISDETHQSSFRSVRGATQGWSEPSEFGYFWSRYFDLGQSTHALGDAERERVDRNGLRRAVAAMEAETRRPMAFKNNTWFTFQADLLAEIFPGAILVACRRDPFFVAQSLYLQRLDLYGDPARWWSVRPPEFERIRMLSPVEQVAEQAVRIVEHMERSLARAAGAKIVDARYERLAAGPRRLVGEIARAAGVDDTAVARLDDLPERFVTTDTVRLAPELATELRSAVDTAIAKTDIH